VQFKEMLEKRDACERNASFGMRKQALKKKKSRMIFTRLFNAIAKLNAIAKM
jgi:hypothetical protein